MKTGTKSKRLLSMLLALMMVLTLLPTTAFAAPERVEINKTNFPDDIFREYVKACFDITDDDILTAVEISAAKKINVASVSGYHSCNTLKGVEYFTALTSLDCSGNSLTSLDLSKNTALTSLKCVSSDLTSLDLSKNTALKELYCGNNQLTSLDLSKNTVLTELDCGNNQLTSLDVSKNTALTVLGCADNQLTSLDVSKNTALTSLFCYGSQLTSLDVSKNTALKGLYCDDNQLTSLDVSKNTALTVLGCAENQLTSLDLSKNTALTVLYCGENQLTSLDVSKNTKLIYLWCGDNQLTSLDVSKNTALTELDCGNNQLTSLDVSKNTALGPLVTYSNARVITLSAEKTFDLSTLPGFDVSKAKHFVGGTVSGNILTATTDEITYDYDCGNGKTANFKLLVASEDVEINKTNFPDDAFREYVNAKFDTTDDDILTTAEIAAVKEMTVTDKKISTLKGVEYFTALTSLNCSGNSLTSLDVSKNTKLTDLKCYNNQLTSLDLSKNTALEELWCERNQLTSLDVSKNTALNELDCYDNPLTSLDVSKNTALTDLDCKSTKLTSLDLSKNTALKRLYCGDNQLTSLDLSKNTALTELLCYDNPLTSLDLSKNTALESLATYSNVRAITLSAGKTFDLSTLPGFDVSKASNFVGGTVSGNILTATADEITYDYDCGNGKTANFKLVVGLEGVEINKTNFPDDAFREYVNAKFDTTDDDILTAAEIAAVKEMTVTDKKISTLKGVEYFTALTSLNCSGNSLTSLDVSNHTALKRLNCEGNKLTSLDVSKNTALTVLECGINDLTSLDVSKNTALVVLYCDSTNLTSLDVSKNTALEGLCCDDNQLTSLDLSQNTALTDLKCYNNQLTSLDVSKNTALRALKCYNNQLTNIDVSKNTALTVLECGFTNLASLDLSKNTALKELDCSGNYNLTSLDVSKNTALEKLFCAEDQLTSLDLSQNTVLRFLDCSENQLTSLDLSKNTALHSLECQGNRLTSLDLSKNTALEPLNTGNNVCAITLSAEKTWDLSTLPGFDVSKASNFVGGTVSGNILTATTDEITYDYDCGNSKTASFKLVEAPVELAFADNTAYDVPAGQKGSTYTATTPFTATGGKAPYTFTITPKGIGLDINGENKLVFTRPAETAATTATIKCKDAANNTKTITIAIDAVSSTVAPDMPFVDVPDDAYYKDAVVWAIDKGITTGTSATTFSPNGLCTRAQSVTFLWRASGSPTPKTTAMPFHDVPAGSYYYNAVLWAVEQGIVTGTSATAFSPSRNCSRAQIVTMLWRMEGAKDATISNPFADVNSSAYYTNAVLWAVGEKITEGTSATTFSPNGNCTRAQIVTFIYRDMK